MQIHFIEKARQQKLLDQATHRYESGNWHVAEDKAKNLIGGRIYFHQSQSDPSYFGGTITAYRVLPHPDPAAGRVVFEFIADQQGKGVRAGTSGWSNEQKTIV